MNRTFLGVLLCVFQCSLGAQEAGSLIYGNPRRHTSGVTTGSLSTTEAKGSVPVPFIEANVLLNVKPDEYVAVFALAQEGPSLTDANAKLSEQLRTLASALESLGIKREDTFIDFISQNRIYDFTVADNAATEKLTGFEVKNNISVRYKDRLLLDKILSAAAQSSIFDLVKVDYVVRDMGSYRERLLAEASKIIKRKEGAYARLFGIKMKPATVAEEKHNAFFPSESYNSYTAYESGGVYRGNLPVINKRKTATAYYAPLDPAEFDLVLNPSPLEPTVQLTLYLKLRYGIK